VTVAVAVEEAEDHLQLSAFLRQCLRARRHGLVL
jgi:hypothetical protein